MNRAAILFLISTFLTIVSTSGNAHAFDGKRKGFQIGVGVGAHTSEFGYESNFAPASVDSEENIAVSFLLGYGFSNQVVGYLGAKGGSLLIDDRNASLAISGLGVSMYLNEQSPSLYVTGLIGSAAMAMENEHEDFHDTGEGWLVGVGYELTDRLHLELSHARADLRDQTITANKSTMESSFLTLQYNWY